MSSVGLPALPPYTLAHRTFSAGLWMLPIEVRPTLQDWPGWYYSRAKLVRYAVTTVGIVCLVGSGKRPPGVSMERPSTSGRILVLRIMALSEGLKWVGGQTLFPKATLLDPFSPSPRGTSFSRESSRISY